MTPNGTMTEEKVRLMIITELKEYDIANSARHAENSRKLDRLLWAILGTLLTAASSLVVHLLGK